MVFNINIVGKVNSSKIREYFDDDKIVIINVNKGKHWVLMIGYSDEVIYVNDPGYNRSEYGWS
jgi:hypothetical protein